jgi:tRNA dimethylallyltransferase
MLREAKRLHTQGLSFRRMEALGLEYRYEARYLQGNISKERMIDELERAIYHYAKRQITWFKRNKKIQWFEPRDRIRVEKIVKTFL